MSQIPFEVKDCNLSLIATGQFAESLIELRDLLRDLSTGSLYYHFWGGRLRISFVHPEYHNDFAHWAHTALHDEVLTERLAIIDPTEFPDLEELRRKVIDVIEDRLEEEENMYWARKQNRFHFLRSIIIVYDTDLIAQVPADLKTIAPKLSPTSIFYHFIDAVRRTDDHFDDFSRWLADFGNQFDVLRQKIKLIDPYFLSLSEIRQKLTKLFEEHL